MFSKLLCIVVIDNLFVSFCACVEEESLFTLKLITSFGIFSADRYDDTDFSLLPSKPMSSETFRISDEYENNDDISVNIDDFGVEMSDDVPDDFRRKVKLNKEFWN